MILYYSGTGNSAYVAKRIAAALNDDCENLFERLKNNNTHEINSDKAFVIVTPTYGWQIPHILRDWLYNTKLTGSKDIYFVMTCGGEIGNSAQYVRKICDYKNMNLKGCAEVVMPENYIAMFGAPDREEALAIIDKAEPVIDRIAKQIANGEIIPDKHSGIVDKLKSSIVNAVYYPVCLHAKKFTVSDACIGCGKCAASCVMSNIKLVDGKPVWNDNCTHCMACICGCPTEAIEYGNKSKGQPRYICPKS